MPVPLYLEGGSRNADLNGRRRTRLAAAKISASLQFPWTIACARDPFQTVDVNQVELLRCQSGEPCHAMPCSNAVSPTGFHGYQGMCLHKIEMCRRRFDRFRTCKLPSKNVQASHEKMVWLVHEQTHNCNQGSALDGLTIPTLGIMKLKSNRMSWPHEPAQRQSTRRPNFKRQAMHFLGHRRRTEYYVPQFHPHGVNLMTHQYKRRGVGRVLHLLVGDIGDQGCPSNSRPDLLRIPLVRLLVKTATLLRDNKGVQHVKSRQWQPDMKTCISSCPSSLRGNLGTWRRSFRAPLSQEISGPRCCVA
ncbi:hypothetical protein FPOAC2_09073 [Fusarium poae]